MHYTRLTAEEAKQISITHQGDPFCISLGHLYEEIKTQSYTGTSNCYITVPEEKLHEFKKDLEDNKFRVFSSQLQRKDYTILNNIFSRYPAYPDLYQLEIEWH